MSGSAHNRLLKILHIDPERNWGGGEVQVLALLSYLADKGHENDLLAHPRGRLFERAQSLPIRTHPFVMRNDIDVRPVFSLRRRIVRERYDIVHFHTKRAHALSLWLPRGRGSPKYVVSRHMDYRENAGWYTRQLYCRRVDGIIAISKPILSLLVETGVPAARIRLIHSGVDTGRFTGWASAAQHRHDPPVVGMIAVLEERKGHTVLLEAAALLKAQGRRVRYLLAGDGSLRSRLEQQAERLGLAEEVTFLGFVESPATVLAEIDLFAMPSLFEGLGIAALEAMAAGKPVIASRVGGLAEVVDDGVTGLLFTPGDPGALASAVVKLLDQPALAEKLATSAAEYVRRHFTIEQMAKKNEAYYHELVTGPIS